MWDLVFKCSETNYSKLKSKLIQISQNIKLHISTYAEVDSIPLMLFQNLKNGYVQLCNSLYSVSKLN